MAINKRYLVVTIAILTTIFYFGNVGIYESNISVEEETHLPLFDEIMVEQGLLQVEKNWRNLTKDEDRSLSMLGRILYLNEEPPQIKQRDAPYKILIWKYGPTIEKRHIYHFEDTPHNPFEGCSAKNCILTNKDADFNTSDLVIVHLHRTKSIKDLPPRENRNSSQIWAFLTDESPYHTFLQANVKLPEFNGIFNWSMTYRMDSDIPVPYGRAIEKELTSNFIIQKEFNNWRMSKRNDVLVAIMGSNCGSKNHRWQYVKELQKHIAVDAYGHCGTLKCAGHFGSDCPKLNDYLFYLAFENSNCDDYLTEKLWWNAYEKKSIPIIMGSTKRNVQKLLPYHSYILVDDFASPRDLANFLLYLNNTPSELAAHFFWRSKYTISNEHGYFKSNSYHYCRVCEALNYNSKEIKVYDDLEAFWSTKNCYPPWDEM